MSSYYADFSPNRSRYLSELFPEYSPDVPNVTDSQFESMQEWMGEIVDILYGKLPYNANRLEESLDELANHLNMRLPTTDLAVTAKG